MEKKDIYNNLQRYAKVINRIDWESRDGYETIKVYFYEDQFYMVEMLNGVVQEIAPIQYIDYKVVGEVESKPCCICGKEFIGYGNNPSPVKEQGKCCNECNDKYVIPKRLEVWKNARSSKEESK